MKKILFLIFALLSLILLRFPEKSFAATVYTEEEEVCYAQCTAFKFVWQGDFCYDTFQNECSMGKGNTIKETIKFLKSIYGVLKDGSGVDTVFKAWFVCKPLIEQCIVPQLQECRSTCALDSKYYAPDLSVGHPYADFVYHGVTYNDDYHTLTFKVINNGRGYAWNIGAGAVWGHTRDRDGLVSGGGLLFKETIPEMIYAGARNGPPKTVGDYVVDFLIEESNFAKYLQSFKSDADNYDIPTIWFKTIPFTAPDGELTKVIFNVDGNQDIKERSETNNTFTLIIDKLPTPPSFKIENFKQKLENGTLNNFLIEFDIKNNGEENGQAFVKIFEDKYNGSNTQTPLYENSQTVQGLNKVNFGAFIKPDINKSDDYCGKTKKYELMVFDNKGKVDSLQFSLPLYFGSVRGRVEDLFGKKVEGATVSSTGGQSTTVNKYGSYFLNNIDLLGNVTITATHPEFSKAETKILDFKINNINDPCAEGSLTFNNVNFILKDQDVLFTISVKDGSGFLVPAHVLASNQDWRFEKEITDELTPMPGMQPGKYVFTISAPGYKTISQDVNAVPNNQNLEFTLEKLNGRPTDGGLTIFTQPQLLWQMNRGEEILANITASKDGKLVVLYTTRNKLDSGKLYFLDSLTGNKRKTVTTIATGGNSQASLDCSYDGGTTALYVHHGTAGITKNSENVLKLFNNQGNSIGEKVLDSKSSATLCEVSPDGFYLYPYQLMNKGLYEYTRFDIQGVKDSEAHATYVSNETLHFTTANNIVSGCPKGSGQCLQTIYKNELINFGMLDASTRNIDSSQDGSKIAIQTLEKVYLFSQANKLWEKEVITRGDPLSVSVSPGGNYVIYSTAVESKHPRIFKIFTNNNIDKTFFEPKTNEDVIFVHANDKGIFYAVEDEKIIKYYQAGSYSTDYNPQTVSPTPVPHVNNDVSSYKNGAFNPVGDITFYTLEAGTIYMANKNTSFDMQDPYGSLNISNGSLFSVDRDHHPILLKGQMTANFNSPATLYAIKFDRFDMNLFQEQLNKFIAGNLPQSEYFIIKNIHTKFTLKNSEGKFNLASENGEVSVTSKEMNETIQTGKQITIDKNNKVEKSIYMSGKIYAIFFGVLILAASIVLFIYRKTKIGGAIINILKKTAVLFWKIITTTVIFVWKMIQKIAPILWKWTKRFFWHINKLLKRK